MNTGPLQSLTQSLLPLSNSLLESQRPAPRRAVHEPELTGKAVELTDLINKRTPARNAVIATPTFLERCWAIFVRFLRWIGFEIAPEDVQKSKMLYAMNLFKNYDPAMAGAPNGSGFSLPLATALKEKKKLLQSIGVNSDTVNAMEQCAVYAEKIATAQSVSILARGKIVQEVSKDIRAKAEALLPGQKLYFPAGLKLDGEGSGEQTHGIICQITKKDDDTFDLQMFYDTEKVGELINENALGQNVSPRYNLKKEKFDEDLSILLEALAVTSNHANMGLWEKLRLRFKLVDRAGQLLGQAPLPPKAIETAEKLKELFKELDESKAGEPAPQQIPFGKLKSRGEATHLLQAFAESVGDPDAAYAQLAERTLLFLEIYDQRDHDDAAMNRWLAASARTVIQHITKFFQVNGIHEQGAIDDTLQGLLEKFTTIVEDLDKKNHAAVVPEVTPIVPGKKSPRSFNETIYSPQALIPLNKMDRVERNGPVKLETPFPSIDFASGDFHAILKQLRKDIKECEKLSKKQKLEKLSYRLDELQSFMDAADQEGLWDKVPEGLHAPFASLLHHLTSYHAQVHFGTNKPGPLPSVMLHLFKNMQRAQKLAVRNDPATGFKSYTLDMTPFREILEDPWLSLGAYGKAIQDALDTFEVEGSTPLDLTNPNILGLQSAGDQQYFQKYAATRLLEGEEDALCEAFSPENNQLDIQIIYMRRMKVLMLMMMARHNTLVAAGLMENFRDAVNLGLNKIGLQDVDLKQQRLKRQYASVNRKLHKTNIPKGMEINTPWSDGRKTLHMTPYGLDFTGYHPGPSPFPSQYQKTEQEVTPLIRHLIDPAAEDWETVFDQLAARTDLSPDILEQLRKLNEPSPELRILKILNLLSNHPDLLADPVEGMGFQRLLTLTLFRNNQTGQLLETNQNLHRIILQRLEGLREQLFTSQNIRQALYVNTLIRNVLELQPGLPASYHEDYLRTIQSITALPPDDPLFLQNRRSIHYHLLLHCATDDQKVDWSAQELSQILKRHFTVKQMPSPAHERNRQEEELISLFMHRLFPLCETTLNEADWNLLINDLVNPTENLAWEKTEANLTFKQGDVLIDLVNGTYSEKGVRHCYLPESLSQVIDCKAVFGVDNLSKIAAQRLDIRYEGKHGPLYEFHIGEREYKIIQLPGQQTLVYKKMDTEWFQLQTLNTHDESSSVPMNLLDKINWVSPKGNRLVVEAPEKGESLFTCTLNSQQMVSTEETSGHSYRIGAAADKEGRQILNPWKQPEFAHFLKIAPPVNMQALGKGDKVGEVHYNDSFPGYRWIAEKGKWYSLQFPDHYLSQKILEEVIDSGNMFVPGTILNANFSHYHILESDKENPKLVIPRCSYTRSQKSKLSKAAQNRLEPVYTNAAMQWDTFDIESDGTIKGDHVEGYLNLAYLFFAQGKYDRALEYIQLIQNMPLLSSEESLRILRWFERTPCHSRKGQIVLLHLKIHLLDQHELNATTDINNSVFLKRLQDIVERYSAYLEWEKQGLIPQNLPLNRVQKTRVNILLATIEDPQQSPLVSSLPHDKLQKLAEKIKKILNDEKRRTESLARNPEMEILSALTSFATHCDNLVPYIEHQSVLEIGEAPLFPRLTRDQFDQDIELKKARLQETIATNKQGILSHINSPAYRLSPWERLADTLKRPYQSDDRSFHKIIKCCASNEWEELTAARIISKDNIPQIKKAVFQYLIASMDLKMLKNSTFEEAAALKRNYKPAPNALVFQLLLLEHHLGRFTTRAEVEAFSRLATGRGNPPKGQNAQVSGPALMAMTASYQSSNTMVPALMMNKDSVEETAHILAVAYGKGLFRLQFNEHSPSDSISLRILLRNLWKTVAMGNALQTNPSDIHNLHFIYQAKLELRNQNILSQERLKELEDEIKVLDQIFNFLRENVILNCETSQTLDHLHLSFKSVSYLGNDDSPNVQTDADEGEATLTNSGENSRRAFRAFLQNFTNPVYPRAELQTPAPESRDLGIQDLNSLIDALREQDNPRFFRAGETLYISPNLVTDAQLPFPICGPVSQRDPIIDRIVLLVDPSNTATPVMTLMGTDSDFRNCYLPADRNQDLSTYTCYIYNLDHDDFEGQLNNWSEPYSPKLKKKIALAIAQAKLLTGKFTRGHTSSWGKKIDKAFEKWLKKQTETRQLIPAEVEAKFIKYLQLYRPSFLDLYEGSSLAKAFETCKRLYCYQPARPTI